MAYLVLNSSWQLSRIGPGAYVACREGALRFLKGAIYDDLIPLIHGDRPLSAVVEVLSTRYSARVLRRTLNFLVREGILHHLSASTDRIREYWEMLGADPQEAASGGLSALAEVISIGSNRVRVTSEALRSLGIRIESDATFRLVIVEDYLDPALEELNREAIARRRPWILVRPFGRHHWLGPLFIPGRTACWRCLASRLRCNVWSGAGTAAIPASSAATEILAAVEAAKWILTGRSGAIEGKLRTFDTVTLETQAHWVVRFPQCVACGEHWPAEKNWQARIVSPLRHHSSAITGIFSPPKRLRAANGIYVYGTRLSGFIRHDPNGTFGLTDYRWVGGKGLDPDSSRTACMAEAIERYSVQFHGDEPRIKATFESLGPQAVPPDQLVLNAKKGRLASGRFRPDLVTEWVMGRSIGSSTEYFLPAPYCYLDYVVPWCQGDSNGCAAGRTFEEATLRGFLELVERDAFAMWWYNRVTRPARNLDASPSSAIAHIRELFERSGRHVEVLDATSDFGIPVMISVAARKDGSDILIGSAAALDPEEATLKALLEAGVFLTEEGLPAEQMTPARFSGFWRWRRTARLQDHPYLIPQGKSLGLRREPPEGPPARLLAWCFTQAKRAGLDLIAIDMTRPEVGIPVARVIAPGMRHWKPAFAPGRLYEIPVALGWRKTPIRHEDLNPTAFFF